MIDIYRDLLRKPSRSSFLSGAGSIMNMGPSTYELASHESSLQLIGEDIPGFQQDAQHLAGDWQRIGNYLFSAPAHLSLPPTHQALKRLGHV